MAVLLFTFAVMLSLSNAQDNDSNEMNSYGNINNCIRKYRDLEKYVLNNEDLMDNLTEAYFKTGKPSTQFVRITYKFKILLPVTNSTNDTTISYDDNDGEFTCVDNQKTFIWSSSALYLLGPEPLFWLTLFAVNVHESSVTVQLPCFCNDAYDNLLPRLTYLIKIYPASMQFQSQTVQFISTYFFETKAPAEDNYRTIVNILGVSSFLPLTTFCVFSYLVYFYSEWIVRFVEKYVADAKEKVRRERLRDRRNHQYKALRGYTDDEQDNEEEEKEKINRRIKIRALILTFICLSIALLIFHIIASVKLIQYGNEVLHVVKQIRRNQLKNELHNKHQDEDNQGLPILYTVSSLIPVIILIGSIVFYFRQRYYSQGVDKDLGKYLKASFGIFLVYLGFCFSMYMVLAFINDPIVTGFIYLIGILYIFCVYLVSHSLCLFVYRYLSVKYKLRLILDLLFTQASAISLGYFLTILIFVFTLGNFHDFQAVQSLTLLIIIALLSFFVFKPLFKSIKEYVNIDTTDHDNAAIGNPAANVNNADH